MGVTSQWNNETHVYVVLNWHDQELQYSEPKWYTENTIVYMKFMAACFFSPSIYHQFT